MYAIVKTGGKQYRVEQGTSLLVERLPAEEGAKVALEPLLFVDGEKVLDGDAGVKIEARVVGHERGPKLRVVKFKPKRGYKRRTGHRQDLTRVEVTSIKGPAARKPRAQTQQADKAEAAEKPAGEGRAPAAEAAEKPAARRRATTPKAQTAEKPAPKRSAGTAEGQTAEKPAPKRRPTTKKETPDGS
jgi:large subunit ribosomal protein L21